MRREPAPPERLAVGRRFEPHRLAPQFLAAAYAWVAPFARRRPLAALPPTPSRGTAGERVQEAA